ncbi:MAG: aminotransferase class IV [Gammaproteobacteria bacterium]|nr:aminotransferase class IV [Gammaproteobacteria bacterium]
MLRISEYIPRSAAAEDGIAVRVCLTRLAINPRVAGIKHLNRLEQVLASAELGDAVEGLMLDIDGNVVEGTRSNLFASLAGQWATPLVDRCGVAGVMREYLIDRTGADEVRLSINGLRAATELFVCNSVFGIYPVTQVDPGEGECLEFPVGEATRELQAKVRSVLGLL